MGFQKVMLYLITESLQVILAFRYDYNTKFTVIQFFVKLFKVFLVKLELKQENCIRKVQNNSEIKVPGFKLQNESRNELLPLSCPSLKLVPSLFTTVK